MYTDKEKIVINRINSSMRWIANRVFYNAGDRTRYTKAYDKLTARVYLDHNINLNDRLQSFNNKNLTIFDVLHNEELDLLLESTINLERMYNDAIAKIY